MRTGIFLLLITLSAPTGGLAQPSSMPTSAPASSAGGELERLRREVESLKRTESAHAERLRKLDAHMKRHEEEAEERDAQREAGAGTFKPSLRAYGFFDMSLVHTEIDAKSVANILLHRGTSFAVSSANVYLDAQITPTLSALMEARFTYLPIGQPAELEVLLQSGDDITTVPGTQFARVTTLSTHPITTGVEQTGGVYLERIHISWAPRDWLKVIAGRFLTPYGIWNVDHGSPVIIPASLPYLQVRQLVPLAQTGLQVYGRLFPFGATFFDYGLTLSNGRGPVDEMVDLDQNKALGAFGRFSYQGTDVSASIGCYGYYGRVTDEKVSIVLDVSDASIGSKVERTLDYDEAIVALDARIAFFGALIQSEYVYRRVLFNKPITANTLFPIFGTTGAFAFAVEVPGVSPGIQPDFYSQDIYLLLAYTLPLARWLGSVQVMPFFLYEYNRMDDAADGDSVYVAGLNVRPASGLVLKAQWGHFESKLTGAFDSFILQTAVAF